MLQTNASLSYEKSAWNAGHTFFVKLSFFPNLTLGWNIRERSRDIRNDIETRPASLCACLKVGSCWPRRFLSLVASTHKVWMFSYWKLVYPGKHYQCCSVTWAAMFGRPIKCPYVREGNEIPVLWSINSFGCACFAFRKGQCQWVRENTAIANYFQKYFCLRPGWFAYAAWSSIINLRCNITTACLVWRHPIYRANSSISPVPHERQASLPAFLFAKLASDRRHNLTPI